VCRFVMDGKREDERPLSAFDAVRLGFCLELSSIQDAGQLYNKVTEI
jgi:hypothetical protein